MFDRTSTPLGNTIALSSHRVYFWLWGEPDADTAGNAMQFNHGHGFVQPSAVLFASHRIFLLCQLRPHRADNLAAIPFFFSSPLLLFLFFGFDSSLFLALVQATQSFSRSPNKCCVASSGCSFLFNSSLCPLDVLVAVFFFFSVGLF